MIHSVYEASDHNLYCLSFVGDSPLVAISTGLSSLGIYQKEKLTLLISSTQFCINFWIDFVSSVARISNLTTTLPEPFPNQTVL